MSIRILTTEATRADCSLAGELIERLAAKHLIADKGYDSDVIVEQAERRGMQGVIPVEKEQKRSNVTMTSICTANGIWLRTHSCTSNSGAASLRETAIVVSCCRADSLSCAVASYLVTTLSGVE